MSRQCMNVAVVTARIDSLKVLRTEKLMGAIGKKVFSELVYM